jgi:hypothetical protein
LEEKKQKSRTFGSSFQEDFLEFSGKILNTVVGFMLVSKVEQRLKTK